MPTASFTTTIDARFEDLWALLVDKIENPGRYVPGVIEIEILERSGGGVLRRMRTAELTVVERITVDEVARTIIFGLVDHPSFEGEVVNHVNATNKGPLQLTFALNWTAKREDDADVDLMPMVQGAVLHTKALVERPGVLL